MLILDGRGPELAAAAERRTEDIVQALSALDDQALRAHSALPGWSRLTIACHLRYGAESLGRMTTAAVEGVPVAYYPGGRDQQRPATLEPEPHEAPSDAVRSQLVRMALLRLTEVEVHGSDLGVGLDDWSVLFVSVALPFRLDWLNLRRANHRSFDDRLKGSWLLVATDGPTYLVTVNGTAVASHPASPKWPARAVIESSSRDLLALLLGRPLSRPVEPAGVVQRSPSAALTAARGPSPANASMWTTSPLSMIVNSTAGSNNAWGISDR